MRRRAFGTWQDRTAWALAGLGLVLLLVPSGTRERLAVPLQTVLLAPLRGVAAFRVDVSRLVEENARLSRLAAELAVENARLLARGGSNADRPVPGLDLIRAPIIARDLTTLERYLVVSRGTSHGVRTGLPAITPEGLVGKVVAAGRHQALVQTILDPDSRVAIIDSRSRVPALARPTGRRSLVLDYAPKGSDFAAGDTVITAGLGGLFPKGLPVGVVVSSVDLPGEMFRTVRVEPFADLSRVERVFLVGVPGPGRSHADEWLDNVGRPEIAIPGEDGR